MACGRTGKMPVTILDVPPFSALCNMAFGLRREVFVLEQRIPEEEELDECDLVAVHFVAISGAEVVGTLPLVDTAEHVKIGRVAVRSTARGGGVAKAMMIHAMDHARRRGRDRFYLVAQADKLSFYEKLGFVAFGDVFDNAGLPHRSMRNC